MKEKSETYQKNVNKRGNVPNSIVVRINIYNLYIKIIEKRR
jgi:hypothetical protein